ncbi:HEAT repeat domain-containing protein [bacterium]|nr:HEAT repeat domain-containing protein [bacterium]
MNRNVRRYAWRALLLGLVLVVGGAAATSLVIGRQVRGAVAAAQSWEPGDPVEALLAVATSPDYAVAERNRAVWALGQLGDSRAVAPLATLLPHTNCEHGQDVCRRKLEQAIELCEGAPNVGAVLWRHGRLATR